MRADSIPIRHFETDEELAEVTAHEICQLVRSTEGTPYGIVLSGGRTPLAAYEIVSRESTPAPSSFHVFFSDERMVPFESPENNAYNSQAMLEALDVPISNIHRVNTDLSLEEAAFAYDRELEKFLDRGGRVPLGLLGLGADGHTASLFSKEDIARGKGRFALAVHRDEGPQRVTVTPDFLRVVDRLLILVSGREKDEIVQTLLEEPATIPAGLAIGNHPNVRIWHARERQPR